MFNNSNGYSLADIAAATGGNNRNDGMWDNGAWWIIILFLFCFNGGMWVMVSVAAWAAKALDLLRSKELQLVMKSLMVST